MVALTLFAAVFVFLPLGILGYEFFREIAAQQQLRSACDAGALAGAAALASIDVSSGDQTAAQQNAMYAAANIFCRNNVLGKSLSNANVAYNQAVSPVSPESNQAVLYIVLLDSQGRPVATGGAAARMNLQVFYGYQPAFGSLIHINNVPISAVSAGGLVPFDIALCFDVSGSIDDATPVSLVKRYWTGRHVDYVVPAGGQGNIFSVFSPPRTGTRVNGLPPQNLSAGSYAGSTAYGGSGNMHPFFFTESPAADFPGNQMAGLRANLGVGSVGAGSEVGCPPGNYDPAAPSSSNGNGVSPNQDATAYTDLVVNLDGNSQFQGWTSPDGFSFPNVATLVEAARGNLDLPSSKFIVSQGNTDANLTSSLLPQPRPGYQAAYQARAKQLLTPMGQAQAAASEFLNSMQTNADAHFTLVAFSDQTGQNATSVWSTAPPDVGATNRKVDGNWAGGGTGTFPVPLIALNDPANAATNLQACLNAVQSLGACGMTDIAGSLQVARTQLLSSQHRPLARRAIILFTDGEPNIPDPPFAWTGGARTPAAQKSYDEAKLCAQAGIPVYTIGLAQNPAIKPIEDQILGDSATQPPPPSGEGIARLTGGMYISVTDPSLLTDAFQTIERSLVNLR